MTTSTVGVSSLSSLPSSSVKLFVVSKSGCKSIIHKSLCFIPVVRSYPPTMYTLVSPCNTKLPGAHLEAPGCGGNVLQYRLVTKRDDSSSVPSAPDGSYNENSP